MDSNGNLNYAERRALKPGDRVVYQTETLAHRGEMAGTVSRVGESGIVYIGKDGARYAMLSDFLRRADWTGEAERTVEPAPAPARRAVAPKAAQDTPKAPDAPAGREMARGNGRDCTCGAHWRGECGCGADWTPQETLDLRARVAALTAERDDARRKLKTMMLAAVALIETAKAVCGD